LQEIQDGLLARATKLRDANTVSIDTWEEFCAFFTPRNAEKPELHGGFALAHWDGSREVEDKIKSELKVTIRCIPFDAAEEDGKCVFSGRPSRRRVVFAKAY
jgi:prolyl-tRNA synthetase